MAEPFTGPKLKIARGRRHVAELESQIVDFLSRDPSALLLQVNPQTAKHRLVFKTREPIPDEMSLIFGDAVHNFRVALDLLANDLVALSGMTPKGVYFPFAKTKDGLNGEIKRKMRWARPDLKSIVRSLKPYPGGNDALRALHDLDISDKHVAVIQTTFETVSPAMGLTKRRHARPGRVIMEADFSLLKTEPIDLEGFPADDDGDFETLGKVVGSKVELTILKGLPFGGRPVIATLNELGNVAEGVVQTFETHCLGSK